jgi:hypothetical protein
MNYKTENFFDQEIEFSYDGIDYFWTGDYTVENYGEDEGEYAPEYGDCTVEVQYTSRLFSYTESQEVTPTISMIIALEEEIKNKL